MIRILVADDHAIMRGGLRQLLALAGDMAVGGEATNGAQVMEALRNSSFDLVLLDMVMPGIRGIDLITRIRAYSAKLPILVLSMRNEAHVARSALQAGASGYLTKDNEPEVLMMAIRKTAAGNRFIDPLLVEQMVFENDTSVQHQAHEQLSKREFHILSLLACGKSVNEIAEELAISNKTVSTHKARLMYKMKFSSNADLVRYGLVHGLVD
ncbi:MAG TPA: response regulator transcription factor [Noviherbaspirillum sp.]